MILDSTKIRRYGSVIIGILKGEKRVTDITYRYIEPIVSIFNHMN